MASSESDGAGPKTKVLVIGAGISGLATARVLVNSGHFDVTVVEARPDRIGGRIWTHTLGSSLTPVDLGAAWIHDSTAKNPATQLANKYNVPLFPTQYHKAKVWSERKRAPYSRLMFLYKVYKNIKAIDKLAKKTRRYEEDMTLRDAIIHEDKGHILVRSSYLLALNFLEASFGAPIEAVSARRFADNMLDDSADDAVPIGGYVKIMDKLAEGHDESEEALDIRLGVRVTKVAVSEDDNCVTVTTDNGETITSSAVVVTVPLGILKTEVIEFEPSLPRPKLEAVRNCGFGLLNKLVLEFKEVFWSPKTHFFAIAPAGDKQPGLLSVWFNHFPATGAPILTGICSGDEAKTCESMSDEQLLDLAVEKLGLMFGSERVSSDHIVSHCRTKWSQDEFARGSYSYHRVGNIGNEQAVLGMPVGRHLFFAGEHTSEDNSSTVHGAYSSGVRAANEIMQQW